MWQIRSRTKKRTSEAKRTDRLDRHRWYVENIAERTNRIELGVVLASPAEVPQTRMR